MTDQPRTVGDILGSMGAAARKVRDLFSAAPSTPQPRRRVYIPRSIARGSRVFDAAMGGRLTAGFTVSSMPVDAYLKTMLPVMRGRARTVARSNDYGRAFTTLMRRQIVGPKGIRYQARARGGSGKPDRPANVALEDAWNAWTQHADVKGQSDLHELCRELVGGQLATDGEILLRFVYGRAAGNEWGFALQPINADLLDIGYNNRLDNGNLVHMGIEMDAWRRPVAYHFLTQDDPGSYAAPAAGRRRVRVPARDVVHAYIVEESGQSRGIPPMAAGLLRIHNITESEKAALWSARAGASKMGFFYSEDGGSYAGELEPGGDEGELIANIEPGVIEELPANIKFQSFDPTYPTGEFPEFIKASLRGFAAGVGVSYATISGDLSDVNFSSIRQGVQDERDLWMMLQEWFIARVMRRIHRAWLEQALLRGMVKVGGRPLPVLRLEKYLQAEWRARRWGYVNPLQDAQAAALMLRLRLKAPSDIVADMNGEDYEETLDKIERDEALMKERRIEYLGKEVGKKITGTGGTEPPKGDGSNE